MNTVFFGSSSYVIPVIEFLYKNCHLQLVVTTEKNPTDAIPKFCTEHEIPFLSVEKLDEKTIAEIKKINAPFAVLADFRLLIKQNILDLFPKGILNIHPSLLPQYRGPTPGVAALLDGKKETGVSIMLLDNKLDHGPLLGQETEAILPTDTSVSLYTRLFAKGAQLLEKVLPDYLDGKIKPIPQDETKATYSEYLTRESGCIDLKNPLKIEQAIRAYFPWPGVWMKWNEKIVKLLPGKLIQVEGKKPVGYKDFVNGYPEGKQLLEKLGLH